MLVEAARPTSGRYCATRGSGANEFREGLISTSRIVLLGLVMDMIYQYEVLRTFYPGEAVLMVLLLALIPYFVLRGPIARVARKWVSRPASN